MTKRLDILVNLIKQGNGGKLAKDDLQSVEVSAKEAETNVKALDAKYRELIKDVAAGNRTLDQAQREYKDFSKELGVVGSQSDKARIDFVALNQAVELGKTIFNQAAQAIEAAYETLQEGAQVEAATRTFESLAASIDTTADALLGNLRMATQGMISDLDLMRSANQFTAMGLATTGEEAGRLAEIGSTLGAAFRGDAVAGMEEFALLLANQSIPRLDTFGISAGAVRSRIAELQEQTPGLSRETAFMTAVLEEADITMAKLGDSATNAAGEMAELQASAKNTGDTLKREFAEGLTPTLAALNDLVQGTRDAGFAIDTFADGLSEGISSALDPGVRTLDALSMHMRALAAVDFSSWERFQAT
ncbi:MAG: hypothetical protein KDE34_27755, partial [Anaerolineales bacterium]|nr:hypothetical protein [Anaerolineales bacterium]